jgi:hypothetical protein
MLRRRIACLAPLVLAATVARAGEADAAFTVGVRVVRSARVRLADGRPGAALRVDPAAARGREVIAAIALEVDGREVSGADPGALAHALAAVGGPATMKVTVFPDGRPPALRVRD